MSRSIRAFLAVGVAALLAACTDGAVEGPLRDLKSAGSLSESRLPYGIWGDSPAPTGARPRDLAQEAGWYKRAKTTEKAFTHGDSPSGATPRPIQLGRGGSPADAPPPSQLHRRLRGPVPRPLAAAPGRYEAGL